MKSMNLLIILIVALIAYVTGQSAGLHTAMNAKGVETIVNQVLPGIIANIQNIPIEDISGDEDGYKYEIKDVHFKSLSMGGFNMDVVNGLKLTMRDVSCAVNLDWKFKKTKFPYVPFGSGSADASLTNGDLTGVFALTTVDTPLGKKPSLTVSDVTVSIENLDVKIHGSILSFLYNLIIKMFKSKIRHTLEDGIKVAITAGVAMASETILSTLPMRAGVSTWGAIDFALTGPAQHVGNDVIVPFNGEVYDIRTNTTDNETPRHGMTLTPSNDSLFEILIDTFVFNSGLHVFFKRGLFHKVITDDNKPDSFPLPLNTASFKDVAPHLFEHFPNAAIKFDILLGEQSVLTSVPDQLSLSNVLAVHISCDVANSWVHALTIKMSIGGAISMTIEQRSVPTILPQLNKVTTKFEVYESSIGDIDLTLMSNILEYMVNNVAVPYINVEMLAGIPIPAVNGMQLVNAQINFLQDAVHFATDVQYNPFKEE